MSRIKLLPKRFCLLSTQINMDEGTNNLKMCYGQLLASNHEHEHTLCDSAEDDYSVGGLSIELERCHHGGCGVQFFSFLGQNLQHQDSVHWAILSYVCGAWGLLSVISFEDMGAWRV